MSDAIKWAAITASLLGILAASASAATDKVTVIRGNAVESAAGQRGAKLPTVFRGQTARRAPGRAGAQAAARTGRLDRNRGRQFMVCRSR